MPRSFETHSDVPYKPYISKSHQRVSLVLSNVIVFFSFQWALFFLVEITLFVRFSTEHVVWMGLAVMCRFAKQPAWAFYLNVETDQYSNLCTRLCNGNWNDSLTEWFIERVQNNLTNWIKNDIYTHTLISKMILIGLWSLTQNRYRTVPGLVLIKSNHAKAKLQRPGSII